ncbi:MAG: Ribonuclease P protein component [Candidatus Woesebacteria bacterium GW2011_GWB1_38_5b]|uniref:Ribonuclease P protein component n=1 Tax=Candidatus Woesebacteria bacterium GW2011_GWB1_38_5b TaxID=1618569 RepID=A0A0G0K7W9_9BACT|nr:MAG: Ribonuclease P protein component [Candidatus Woesebacteria bacterium GW2011_GWB1_38_5b]
MLEAKFRLTSKNDFDTVKKRGKVFQSENFSLGYYRRRDKGPSRFGFIVTMAVAREAVMRTKAKRGMREGVRHNITQVKRGYDCVLVAKPTIARRYTADVLKEVKDALVAVNLL